MLLDGKVTQDQLLEAQVNRILRSEELRTSELLRQLLRFLADKTLSGESDQLKEYIVAIDGLGKPATYDPQHNSAVRIQAGRLRQKLADYYRNEGKFDPVIVDLPRGRFKLTWEERVVPPEAPAPLPPPVYLEKIVPEPASRSWLYVGWAILTIAISTGVLFVAQRSTSPSKRVSLAPGWSADIEDLWGPFVNSKQPLIVSIEDPLFVQLRSAPGTYYRDRSLNKWKDILDSPAVNVLRNALKNEDIQPSRYYTAFGEADASFLIGKFLGPRERNMSLVKTSQLSWQQLADNNVLFVGVQNLFFDEKLQEMPLAPQLEPVLEGIRNAHPKPGEPTLFTDHYSTAPSEQGVAYALVTHLPGPLGTNDVESFTSNRSAGYVAAVESYTDPGFAHLLVTRLKEGSGGRMPRYYQVLLRVKFKDEVPTETTYVLSRELHY
jgi:hypothetical protein